MSLTAIVNLAERLLNNSSAQTANSSSDSQAPKPAGTAKTQTDGGDQFTRSEASDNGRDAGLFQASQFISFSAAAEFLLSQTPVTQANAAAVTNTSPASTAVATPAATSASGGNSATNTNAATNVAATGANTIATTGTGTAPAANADTAANSSATSSQNQLQALNNALEALGLNPSELAEVDRIATLIKDFSPEAFTSLVYQLEALAEANAKQAAASTVSTPGTQTAAASADAAANSAATGTSRAATSGASNTVNALGGNGL